MCDYSKMNNELKQKANISKNHAKSDLEKVQTQLLARGAGGIKGVGRTFRIMDDSGDKKISFDEFMTGLLDIGVKLEKASFVELFSAFDRDGSGFLDFEEFLRTLQPAMNNRRLALVDAAFAKMDKTGDGVVTVKDLVNCYSYSKHPKYISGEWTDTQVYKEFLKTFEAEGNIDGKVTKEEFRMYYASVSCSIDQDAYFDLMMRNSWGHDLVV